MSLADARFLMARALGLLRRGWVSLSTRGWRASWQRARIHVQARAPATMATLFQPPSAPFAPFALPTSTSPRVSIVVPVYDHFAHTLACLRALAAHPPCVGFEVLVVDDGSTDDTVAAVPRIAGVRYHRRAANGGFIAACNEGAAHARGEVLCFLNNDTVPQPGWLDALIATLDDSPDIGLVGAQLLYPDGRLQEAGGIVFDDGSGWNYGRYESADDPRFSYARDADYVSGAALAVPRALFEQLGGFDTRYAPAYYEDTDLAFAVRAAGKRVLYQPAARVVHDEGTTAGNDPASGIKAYQTRNRERFAAHRRDALAAQLPAGTLPTPALLHRGQRQILIVDALTPQPDHDSGSLRLVNLMRELRDAGAHVVFLPANRAHAGLYTRQLQQLGIESWYAPYAPRAPAWLRNHGHRFDVVLLCRHYVASEFASLVRRHAPQATLVFDTVDLHYLREQRAADLAGDPTLRRAAQRTRSAELAVIAASDTTLVVSDVEQALLARDAPRARVAVLSNLHRIAGQGLPYCERHDIVFVGGFRHPPNTDAVAWFVREVFPLVRSRLPGVSFHCIGSDPPDAIRAFAGADVKIHGHVPDLSPYMDGCRIAVAPLRYGAGVKGKINLSMAHGQPVVATQCAIEGMHLVDGRDVRVADDAQAFAARIVELYGDEVLWRRLARGGLDNVAAHFSLDSARDTIRSVFLD